MYESKENMHVIIFDCKETMHRIYLWRQNTKVKRNCIMFDCKENFQNSMFDCKEIVNSMFDCKENFHLV